jgi:hypothetical protein
MLIDEADNVSTQQTNIIVDNAPPSLSITVECGDLPDRTYDYNPNRGSYTYKLGRPSTGSGTIATGTDRRLLISGLFNSKPLT